MGLMGFVNLAHGTPSRWRAVIWCSHRHGRNWDGAVLRGIGIRIVVFDAFSMVFEQLFYARLYKATELEQVLLTIGLRLHGDRDLHLRLTARPQTIQVPAYLTGRDRRQFAHVPDLSGVRRAVGCALIAVLWYAFERTNIGAKIRAAVDNRRMARSDRHRRRAVHLTFAVGSGLAALGGGLAIELFGLTPSFAVLYLVFFLLVVAVGGLGSLKGTLAAAILLGVGDTGGIGACWPARVASSSMRSPS